MDYKYNEIMVRFYDAVYENMPQVDYGRYYINKLINAGGPALELGCGTGRVFVPALRQGADVYGIDQSELMLGKLKEKISANEFHRIQLMDATEMKLDRKFRLIIAPFRMFQHLYTVNDQLSVLKNVKEHLVDGGMFIFDVFNPDLDYINKGREESLQFSGEYMPGRVLRRYHTIKPDPLNQLQHITFRFEWDENGDGELSNAEFKTSMRYFFRYELEHLIARSGLKLENIYGADEAPLTENSKTFLIICSK